MLLILRNTHVLTVLDNKDEEFPGVARASEQSPLTRMLNKSYDNEDNILQIDNVSIEEESDFYITVENKDYAHIMTLFITIFSSVLQCSFISYVPAKGTFIQVLYFIRLFADLLDVLFALVKDSLWHMTTFRFYSFLGILRFFVCLYFFIYVLTYPGMLPKMSTHP